MINSEMEIEKLEVWNGPSRPPYNRANLGAATFGYYSNVSIISSNFADNLVIH